LRPRPGIGTELADADMARYLYRVAINCALEMLRSRRTAAPVWILDTGAGIRPPKHDGRLDKLDDWLDKLPAARASAID